MSSTYDFLTLLAHELEPSLLSLEMRLRGLEDHRVAPEEVERCLHEVASIRSLVRNCLLLERREVARRPFPLAPVLEAVSTTFAPIAASRGIALELASSRAMVEGDATSTERILRNLVDNAVKFSEDSGTVWVRVRETATAVSLMVDDLGIGIPREDRERVFEPFVRLDADRAGSGLGLAIARALAEAQGGTLELSTEVERGSSFVLTLLKQ